jgi:hypothetical protein
MKANIDIAEKSSTPLKMYLKSFAILEKASISLKKSSKIIVIFIESFLNKSLHFSANVFRKPCYAYKILMLIKKRP